MSKRLAWVVILAGAAITAALAWGHHGLVGGQTSNRGQYAANQICRRFAALDDEAPTSVSFDQYGVHCSDAASGPFFFNWSGTGSFEWWLQRANHLP